MRPIPSRIATEWPAIRPHKKVFPRPSGAFWGQSGAKGEGSIYIPHVGILFEGKHPVPVGGHDLLRYPETPPPPRPLCHPQETRAVVTP